MFLVTGASGNVGREVVAILQDKGAPVRALHRSRRDELPAGVEVVRGDLNDPDSLAGAFDDVEGVFLLPGYADMPGLVRLAERSGARIILLSGPSADSRDLSNAVTAYMVRSEDAVRAGDVPWTILRPSGFMSNTFQWVHQLSSGDVVTLPFAGVPIAWIDPADIAAVAALALTEPGHDRATYRLTGPQSLTAPELVATLGRALHRRLEFRAETDDQVRERFAHELPPAYAAAFLDFYVDGALDDSRVLTTVAELTGRPAGTYEDWAVRHRDALLATATEGVRS